MPNVNDLKDSKFLTKEDVDPPVIVTIAGWEHIDVSMDTEPERMRYTLSFQEFDKSMVLNTTNGQRIQKVTGESDFDNWIGKEIVLFNDPNVEFGGKLVGGIRVQIPQAEIQAPVRPGNEGSPVPTDEDALKDSVKNTLTPQEPPL